MLLTSKMEKSIDAFVVLQLINYMVVTIIMKDFFMAKYLRDILIVLLTLNTAVVTKCRIQKDRVSACFIVFLFCIFVGIMQSESMRIVLLAVRRYLIPLAWLYVIRKIDFRNRETKILNFVLYFILILSVFGIFQAQVLGDTFLRRLGYPVEYSYAYGRDMLYNSFYFGGFGIQRVVATLSSSNICALVLGPSLIFFLIYSPYLKSKHKKLVFILIAAAYFLTFSRSNILCFIIVVLIMTWKYIPYKKYIFIGLAILMAGAIVIGIAQGNNGIIYKLLLWVQATLTFTESSAAGRSGIWRTAFEQVIKSPLGIGFGHVGAIGTGNRIVFSAENSYLTLALDTGWLGVLSYTLGLLFAIFKLKKYAKIYAKLKDERGRRICVASYAILMYFMGVMWFSNHIQDMEAVTMVYLYAGVGLSYVEHTKNKEVLRNEN